ncbi:lysM and putative peptidoglycan-binding domain-containing protein 3-like [Amphiura filiformis]|uniref:lysM and putative peptidoglycan-binding domain-containing protein 3-like n=1 Tax=Amphiura filiformis TaxID=82378 RepID=UPI003B21EB19
MCKKTLKDASLTMTTVLGPRQYNDHDQVRRSDYLSTSGEVQNVQKGRVYVFGNADVTEDEINTDNAVEMSEMRVRNGRTNAINDRTKNSSSNDEIRIGQNLYKLVERIILPTDSLQLFSLQYGCPMSEIKRINNLINDQDFHARTKIKLPVRLHGLLQEEDEEKRRRPEAFKTSADALTTSVESLDEPTSPSGDESYDEHMYRTISIRMKDESDKRKFLKRMDKDLQKICEQTKTSKDSLDEVTKELTTPRFYPLRNSGNSKWLSEIHCEDISWKYLVLIIILVIAGSAVAVVAFLTYMKHEEHP